MTFAEKVKGVFTKIGKRNLIIIGAVALIGVAICLNPWLNKSLPATVARITAQAMLWALNMPRK